MSDTETQQAPVRPRGMQLAWVLAVAYLLVIVYASLQPFSGWRIPPDEIRQFLTAPWPRYITLEDVLINVAAYVPLGFLLANALMTRFGHRPAVLLALLGVCLLSTSMEALQSFMPARRASNVDLLTNAFGGLVGALAAPLFGPTHGLGIRFAQARRDWFVEGRSGDIGLVLVALWLITQLHPTVQLFGSGNVRESLGLPVWFVHTPQALVTAQAAVAGFNMLGIALVVVALTRQSAPRGMLIAALLGSALATKAFAAVALAKTAGPLAWLTPGVAVGVVLAAIVVYALARLPRRIQWIAAAMSFTLAIAAINVAPDNPYQTLPPQLLAQGPTYFLSYSGIVRTLSELWPFVAVVYAATAAARRSHA